MRTQTVARVLMVSPHQNEMLRRNRSKIFIAPAGETAIDTILAQGVRPIGDYIEAATRAIISAGLHDPTGEIDLRPAFNHNATAGFNQQHLVSTGWLQNSDREVYDLVIELELGVEDELPTINMKSFNGNPIEGFNDNPLCIALDIQDLYPMSDNNDVGGEPEIERQPGPRLVEVVGHDQEQHNGSDADRVPGAFGRVKSPEDGRLKVNRQTAMARRSQDRSDDNSGSNNGRMAGRPGRVKDPAFDFRLKSNRGAVSAEAGR